MNFQIVEFPTFEILSDPSSIGKTSFVFFFKGREAVVEKSKSPVVTDLFT